MTFRRPSPDILATGTHMNFIAFPLDHALHAYRSVSQLVSESDYIDQQGDCSISVSRSLLAAVLALADRPVNTKIRFAQNDFSPQKSPCTQRNKESCRRKHLASFMLAHPELRQRRFARLPIRNRILTPNKAPCVRGACRTQLHRKVAANRTSTSRRQTSTTALPTELRHQNGSGRT